MTTLAQLHDCHSCNDEHCSKKKLLGRDSRLSYHLQMSVRPKSDYVLSVKGTRGKESGVDWALLPLSTRG